jgi:hypothetical protein
LLEAEMDHRRSPPLRALSRAVSAPRARGAAVLAVVALVLPRASRADSVTAHRFARPVSIQALHVWEAACGATEDVPPRCLNVDYVVAHRREDGTVDNDSQTYPLDPRFAEHLTADFGEYAAIALREADAAIEHLGLLEDADLRPAAQRCQQMIQRWVHYRVQAHARLPLGVEHRVAQVAALFHAHTRQVLVITSGTRTPEEQASAMYLKLVLGASLRKLYRKWEAAQEIKRAYDAGWSRRLRRRQIIAAMATVIREQMQRDVYVSPHLKAGAVDVRSRTLRTRAKAAFERAVASFTGLRLLREEKIPPHFHLEVEVQPPAESATAASAR